jgi:hypothetical protein
MWKTTEGSGGRLLQLCIGYFLFYIVTGIAVKYFTGSPDHGLPGVGQIEYLVYSTLGGSLICLFVVLLFRWYRIKSNRYLTFGKLKIPSELLYIIPSGICTAIVIPTTTLMYLLPISVMVAMVIMRGSIIVTSRIIDAIQIKQGILKKKVTWEEEVAVVFALVAISVDIFFNKQPGGFDFINSPAALTILGSYVLAYFIRIYIMNYYKNTRGKNVPQDNKGFFALEQIVSGIAMVAVGYVIFKMVSQASAIVQYQQAFTLPSIHWSWEMLAGTAYGISAFFSVFLFMFKGRTATFAGLVNRLTSLIAGTTATLGFALFFGGKLPSLSEWLSLTFIFVAVKFLTMAEKKRLTKAKLEAAVAAPAPSMSIEEAKQESA